MTSTPEDGEFEQRLDEHATLQPSAQNKATSRDQPALIENADLVDDEDELAQLDPEDFGEEQRRADVQDEADTVPDDVGLPTPRLDATKIAYSPSVDDSASIPDDTPSIQGSGFSTPQSDAFSTQPSAATRVGTPPRRPFDLRFQSRLSSSPLISPRPSSPAFLHSRQSSLASIGVQSNASEPSESTAPWEVIRWTRLGKITSQSFSELGRRNFGSPTCLAVTDNVVIGTSKGLVLVYDHHQSLKGIIGTGTKAVECGSVTALAISADHTTVAAGHATGNIFTWEIGKASRPFLHIPPLNATQSEARRGDGHIEGSTVLHIGFLGFRRTALVSADDKGMAFSQLATRGTGPLARSVRTTRVLGRYPDLITRASKPSKKSSVLAFAPLPLGNVEQKTDSLGLVAMLTPYLLVIVSTTPIAQTQHKAARPKEVAAHSAMTAALAWFPAIKLKGSSSIVSNPKLVYAWSNVLTVLELHEVESESEEDVAKPPELQFRPRSRFKAEEAIVAVQWLSRSVIAVLTITQQLLIIEDVTMKLTDSFDLLPKDIYHTDVYSQQLRAVIENLDEEDTSMHGVVADAFHMSFRAYKGRLFLLGFKNVWWGSLTNWADRLLAMMDAGDFIGAIRLATSYYLGSGEKLTIGLPEDSEQRTGLVRERLIEMMSASLRYAFGKNQIARTGQLNKEQLKELADACVTACLSLNDKDFLFDEVFAWYDDHDDGAIFVDVLEPHILDATVDSLPPPVIKTLINHFKRTHSASELEEMICLLDPTTMDIDQVTSLCKQNNLYDAYIYVWNTALLDYVSPLKVLLDMSHVNSRVNGHTANGLSMSETAHKMFAYLSFVLTGRVYPLGTFMEEPQASMAKMQLYEFLFSGNSRETLRDADLSESYPSLRRILTFDTASFMRALNEAFEDNFLNDDETMNGSGGDYSNVKIYTRQYVVQILLAVMSSGFDAHDAIYLDMFIGRNLPKYPQYMLLSGSDLQDIFMRLCHYDDNDLQDDAQLSVEYLLTAYHPPDILKLVPVLQRARFYRVLKSLFRQEHQYANLVETFFDDPNDKQGVFEVIRELLTGSSNLDHEQKSSVCSVVREHASDLLEIDVSQAAFTIDQALPELHSVFIHTASEESWSQFRYLRALIEPDGSTSTASTNLASELLEMYVRLMCQYDPGHVVEYVKVVKEDDLRLDSVIPAMESGGIIDGAVILLTRQGQVREAMDRLLKHIEVLQTAIRGLLQNVQESPDHAVTNEAIEDLLESVSRYVGIGVWICQGQKPRSTAKSPRRSSAHQALGFEETLWLDLMVCVVDAARDVGAGISTEEKIMDTVQNTLRTVVQNVFTALLSVTTSAREGSVVGSDFTFLRILRNFLTRAAESSPTLSELRGVIASIFSAYAYEESLLALSNSILDKDLFVHVDEVAKMRKQGWRPRGQICEICRRRVWGPGTGLKIWDAWEATEAERHARRKIEHEPQPSSEDDHISRGKGKATAQVGPASVIEESGSSEATPQSDVGALVVFSCRHLYHKSCLPQDDEVENDELQAGRHGPHDHVQLTCPTCP